MDATPTVVHFWRAALIVFFELWLRQLDRIIHFPLSSCEISVPGACQPSSNYAQLLGYLMQNAVDDVTMSGSL